MEMHNILGYFSHVSSMFFAQIFSKNCSAVEEAFANQSLIEALSYYISKLT